MPKKTNAIKSSYVPPKKVLERYANVLVNFAIRDGKGVQPGDVIRVIAEESAKPLFLEVRRQIWRAGGHVIGAYQPSDKDGFSPTRDFYEHTSMDQVTFFPEKYWKAIADTVDGTIFISSCDDTQALKGIEPAKMMAYGKARLPLKKWLNDKESAGKYWWTIALYGTQAMADEADMSLEEYWDQIIKACYLDSTDPLAKWTAAWEEISRVRDRLNALPIESFRITGPDVDLKILLGDKRKFAGGSGRNIPSFELFTSPDWRGTEGWIKFNQPLYRYGNLIENVYLRFEKGLVVESKASKGEKILKEMIATEGANKVGEFSLTDKRLSRITRFMAETLYDENVGGPHGNTHIALGSSYHDCYDGDPSKVKKAGWEKLGFNDSSVHTDIVSTAPRTVIATLKGGGERLIYEDGKFVI
jgi:aminopeptidase